MASGAYDVAMAVGVEKVKDSGYRASTRIPDRRPTAPRRTLTAAGDVRLVLAPAYAKKYGVDDAELKRGAGPHRVEEPLQRRPQPAGAVPQGGVDGGHLRHRRWWPATLGVFDCAGVADGSAAAIVVRAEDAHRYTDKPIYVKALSFVAGNGSGLIDPELRLHDLPRGRAPRRGRLRAGRHHRPPRRARHGRGARLLHPDRAACSWRTSGSPSGARRGRRSLAGTFDLDGELPVNPDGGLKSFGHPVGASGLRMMFEAWLQLRGEAPRATVSDRRTASRKLALTHNLGGYPGEMVSFVSIVGTEPSE